MTDLAGLFWTKLCEKMSLERSFGDAKEEIQGRADCGAAASDRGVDVAGKGGVLRRRHFPAELLSLVKGIRRTRTRSGEADEGGDNVGFKRLVADLSLEKQVLKALRRATCKPQTAPKGSGMPAGSSANPRDPAIHHDRPG
jgi:hypothetical protein